MKKQNFYIIRFFVKKTCVDAVRITKKDYLSVKDDPNWIEFKNESGGMTYMRDVKIPIK